MNALRRATARTIANLINNIGGSVRSLSSWNSAIAHFTGIHDVEQARRVFDSIPHPDAHQYTVMLTAYCSVGRIEDALQLFGEMPERDVASWNSLIKGCLRCEELRLAQCVFAKMPQRNVISWTTVMDGLAGVGRLELAEELFRRMPWRDAAAWNSMISGYFSNGRVADALSLFEIMPCRNVISWTAVICGLDRNGRSQEALAFFSQMLGSGIRPTSNTFASILTACASAMDIHLGRQLHCHLAKSGVVLDTFVSTSLITLYSNCKQMENSCRIHHEDHHKTVVSWTALITGYCSNGEHQCALDVFHDMKIAGITPNQSTFTIVLNSCGAMEDLDNGMLIHGNTMKVGFGLDVFVGNSLIFMYSKCGNVDDALVVFGNLNERNIISWNSVITGCAQNGCGSRSLGFYKDMVLNLMKPDAITYLGLLTACSHSKMVEKAKYFFRLLTQDQTVDIKLEHCICMVDVLCRSGNLEEAEKFINNMPFKPDVAVWLSLLSACRTQLNVSIATRAAEKIYELEPDCSAAYVLLSNVYASAGRWDDVLQTRLLMKCCGLTKMPGYSGLF